MTRWCCDSLGSYEQRQRICFWWSMIRTIFQSWMSCWPHSSERKTLKRSGTDNCCLGIFPLQRYKRSFDVCDFVSNYKSASMVNIKAEEKVSFDWHRRTPKWRDMMSQGWVAPFTLACMRVDPTLRRPSYYSCTSSFYLYKNDSVQTVQQFLEKDMVGMAKRMLCITE
jgi:hypothetical protein